MRILFLSNLFPPHDLGGMENRCQETVDQLRVRGHSCHVLTSRYGIRARPSLEEGVTRALYLQADINYYRPLDFFVRRPWQERANRRALRRVLDEFLPDVVFVWGMWNLSPCVAYWAEQWLPGRVAYAVAGYWPMEPGVHESYWRLPARRPLVEAFKSPARRLALRTLARERQANRLSLEHVACVSEYVRRRLTEAGALPHGARVIYNGIDPTPFTHASAERAPAHDGLRLIYAGGLVPHKGAYTAIDALGLLQQRGKTDGLRLSVVGGGHPDYEARLKRRVGELDLGEIVDFYGRVPRAEIPGILAAHDVFLFTSVYEEPIARAVMEAMAAKLAVIGTAVGGQGEMLERGVNALVFPPEDSTALSECILQVRQDPTQRAQLAEAGRRTVLERFTLERMIDELEAWLEEIEA
jgi:glycogen(starch) synthase